MKNKLNKRLVTAVVILCAGVSVVMGNNEIPCVGSARSAGSCGKNQSPTPDNSCVEIDCNDTSHDCGGSASDYFCSTGPYSSTCNRFRYFLNGTGGGIWGNDPMCTDTVVDSGTVPASCTAVTGEIGGCN